MGICLIVHLTKMDETLELSLYFDDFCQVGGPKGLSGHES